MTDVVEHPKRQRIGAYALILRDGDVLLTRMSARTPIAGHWTLPGGGVDHGEDPRRAVEREVYEETGLRVEAGEVVDVHSTHFVGPRSDGLVENFHGVHLIFRATVSPESLHVAPTVLEQDSSTEESRWVSLEEARSLPLLSAAQHALERLIP